MVTDLRNILDPVVPACTIGLFRHYGVEVRESEHPPAFEHVAVLGFEGEGLRGTFGLGVSQDLLERSAGLPLGAEGVPHADWLAELANQLLGRVKNRLVAHGANLGLAQPMVLRGVRLEIAHPDEIWSRGFETAHGELCIWLDVQVEPGVRISERPDPSVQPAVEGDLILF